MSAIGAYCLLRRDFPGWRAMAIGVAVSFANFYALAKYPGHLNIACAHWAVLSVITDYLIFRRVVFRRAISARLLLVRALLLMLSFGLDLGYICGLGLTSLVVTSTIAGIVLAVRAGRSAGRSRSRLREFASDLFASAAGGRRQCLIVGGTCATAAFLYLPLIWQILGHAKQFGSLGDQGAWYANPLRLILPCIPGNFNAVKMHSHQVFSDTPEGLFAGSPGWMFVIPGCLGLMFARRRLLVFAPLLVLLASILVYHPHDFPLLKLLPWFSFARVQGRLTIIYPVIFAIFCLGIPDEFFRRRGGQLLAGCALGLMAIEVCWAYHGPIVRRYENPLAQDGSFDPFMQTVHDSAGEAVLEWLFCVSSGNGLGAPMNGFYDALYTTFTLRQFHEKKTVGQFFSRLHPSQSQVFYDRGWPRLFSPDSPNILAAKHQARDMTPQEWRFMEDFFVFNDFCGIILYVELLPPETLKRFHEQFGQPVVSTSFGRAGRMEFIPKPKHLRALVNRELGAKVALSPASLGEGQWIDMASSSPLKMPSWHFPTSPSSGQSPSRLAK